MKKIICNCCGNELSAEDIRCNTDYSEEYKFSFELRPGYGSVYDGEKITFDLCPRCFDHLITKANDKFSIKVL